MVAACGMAALLLLLALCLELRLVFVRLIMFTGVDVVNISY